MTKIQNTLEDSIARFFSGEPDFSRLIRRYDVLIMKHCYHSSDILEDIGKPDPSSDRRSIENYQSIYRTLRTELDKYQHRLFIICTLPPRHRLYRPTKGNAEDNAARASQFSDWLKTDFLRECGAHPSISVWDLRSILINSGSNFLNYDYEMSHDSPDSHPNRAANNIAGPLLAQFVVDSIETYFEGTGVAQGARAVFLHHSLGGNLYRYPDLGMPAWIKKNNRAKGTSHRIDHIWFPKESNMPIDYIRRWPQGKSVAQCL